MKFQNIARACAIFLTCLWLSAAVQAADVGRSNQVPFPVRIQKAAVKVVEVQDEIRGWRRQAFGTLTFVIVIGLSGFAAAVLQAMPKKSWTSVATGVAGGVVSLATVLNAAIYEADFKTLNKRAAAGTRLVKGAETWIDLARRTENDLVREEALAEVSKRFNAFDALVPSGQPSLGTIALLPSLSATLFADESCGCLGSLPTEKAFAYGCGSAEGDSLSEARTRATENALARLAGALASRAGKSPELEDDALTEYVRRVASEVDSCATVAKDRFAFSLLLRIPDRLADRDAQTVFVVDATGTLVAPRKVANAHGYEYVARSSSEPVMIPVRAQPAKAGDFVFTFKPRQQGAGVLDLESIQVREDGSPGATKWSFLVFVNGVPVSQIPEMNYTDGKNSPGYQTIASVPLQGANARVGILGYRQ